MTRTLVLEQRTVDEMRKCTTPGYTFKNNGTLRADGQWEMEIDEELYERLESVRMKGESLNDVVLRAAACLLGNGRMQ